MAAPEGNKFGANRREWQGAIKRALSRKAGTVAAGLDKIASDIVDEAYNGDKEARREIWDRLDGKCTQPLSGDDDMPPLIPSINVENLTSEQRRALASIKLESDPG